MRRFPLVHALGAAAVDHPLGIAQHGIFGRQPHRLQQLDAGDRGSAGAVDDDLEPGQLASGQVQRVDQPRRGDDRGAVLVVVEYRDVEQLAQPLLDHEAFRGADVLEVDAAKGRVQEAHAIDEFVDILGVDLQVDRIDVGKALEQRRLALHDRLRRQRAEVAEAEDGGAVRDHRDEIALRGVVEDRARLALDVQAGKGDTGRIGERQIALRGQRFGRRDRQFAGPAAGVKLQGFVLGRANGAGVHILPRGAARLVQRPPAAKCREWLTPRQSGGDAGRPHNIDSRTGPTIVRASRTGRPVRPAFPPRQGLPRRARQPISAQ